MTAGDSDDRRKNDGLRRLRSAGPVLVLASRRSRCWSPPPSRLDQGNTTATHHWHARFQTEPSPRSGPTAPGRDPIELGSVAWSTWWTARPPGPGGSASPPSASGRGLFPCGSSRTGRCRLPTTSLRPAGTSPGVSRASVVRGSRRPRGRCRRTRSLLQVARAQAGRLDPHRARGRQRGSLPGRGPRALAEGGLPDPPRVRRHPHGDAAASDLLGELRSLDGPLRGQHDRVRGEAARQAAALEAIAQRSRSRAPT